MPGDADIAALGAVLGDRARCRVLLALADGRALAASVLAAEAGVAPSTASVHLRKLVDADLLRVETHGRHRYYRLAGPHVGRLLEILAEHSPAAPIRSLREGTRAHAVREARYCYDHLAGRLGVALMDGLLERGILTGEPDPERNGHDRLSAPGREVDYRLTDVGAAWLRDFGIDPDALGRRPRPVIRYCLDWSEQRHHLAGALGAAVAQRLFDLGWVEPAVRGRAVFPTAAGAAGLTAALGIELDGTRRLGDRRARPRRTQLAGVHQRGDAFPDLPAHRRPQHETATAD
jgi:DNA-binding transcriptional ArsR family regulator